MVNFSDLIGKQKKQPDIKPEEPVAKPQSTPATPQPHPAEVKAPTQPPVADVAPKKVEASAPSEAPTPPVDDGATDSLFSQILAYSLDVQTQQKSGAAVAYWQPETLFDVLPQETGGSCEQILMTAYASEDAQGVHVAIRAILIHYFAQALGFQDFVMRPLTLAGLLFNATSMDASLSSNVSALVTHLQSSAESAGVAMQTALELQQEQTVKRTGIMDEDRPLCAKLIAVADVYDHLTNPKSALKLPSPASAIRLLIEAAEEDPDKQSRRVVKSLIDVLSLYPKGSLVRLNTNEVARVDAVHRSAPLRPAISVFMDADQNRLNHPRPVDLLQHPFIYIKDIVDESDGVIDE